MADKGHRIAFGPIPSRRLGRSLGVNNIPVKVCSYDCRYCQAGPTTEHRVEPREFFTPEQIHDAVADHLRRLREGGQDADYITFVPDGEPTLDSRLGESILALREFGIPIGVITNSTLLCRADVRSRVVLADLVSVKVDTVDPDAWRRLNRPHPDLDLQVVLDGIRQFAAEYHGTLISETMLVSGINDSHEALAATAAFLAQVAPRTAYIAIPVRPPAVEGTRGPDDAVLVEACRIFAARLTSVELLAGHEVAAFGHTGDARADLLAITAVHPMRDSAIAQLLANDGADWGVVEGLLEEGSLREVWHGGQHFYRRAGGPRQDDR